MHENVIWFDTAACIDATKVGEVNQVYISADELENRSTEIDDNRYLWDSSAKTESEEKDDVE